MQRAYKRSYLPIDVNEVNAIFLQLEAVIQLLKFGDIR